MNKSEHPHSEINNITTGIERQWHDKVTNWQQYDTLLSDEDDVRLTTYERLKILDIVSLRQLKCMTATREIFVLK